MLYRTALAVAALPVMAAVGQVVAEPWPAGEDAVSVVGAAGATLSGWYASAASGSNFVDVRDVNGAQAVRISAAQMSALLPWMNFNTVADGPVAVALSDSGRLLFIAVRDTNSAPDGLPGDAILRYDTFTGDLRVFARVEIGGFNPLPLPALAHFRGRLYVGWGGAVRVYRALANDLTGPLLATSTLGGAGDAVSIAVDRERAMIIAAAGANVSRAPVTGGALAFSALGAMDRPVRALAYSEHFGAPGQGGLFVTLAPADGQPTLYRATPAMAAALTSWNPAPVDAETIDLTSLSATADGALLGAGAALGAVRISESADTRMTYQEWMEDEFAQVLTLASALISADGAPAGWVTDADVQQGWQRFHPVTPDAALWAALLHMAEDAMRPEGPSRDVVLEILQRYAGQLPGPAPSRTADGIYRHWIDPFTGGVKPGWDPEFATMSTMKIVLAAARARQRYAGDSEVRSAAEAIICDLSNWDAYFSPAGTAMFLKGNEGGGATGGTLSGGWHEGLLFAEQAGAYGGQRGQLAAWSWLTPSLWPTASYVSGQPVVTTSANNFSPAFITHYPLLTVPEFRASADWQTHTRNLAASHAAWMDDNGPRWYTVFSAGTTRADWGGYHADSLSNHPGDVSTFPSVMAFSAGAWVNAEAHAVSGYHAYRTGARQTFLSGASVLYRRSNIDPGYMPNSAGLPDLAVGALALAGLLQPGLIDSVLAGGYPECDPCVADWNEDGGVDGSDVQAFFADWETGNADVNEDGGTDGADVEAFFDLWEAGC
jgi:hypothetical protein